MRPITGGVYGMTGNENKLPSLPPRMAPVFKAFLTVVIIISLSLGVVFYYKNTFARHIFGAELIRIEENNDLIFKLRNGDELSVKSPKILIPLLHTNKSYYVVIYKSKLGSPFIREIKEIPE